MYWFEAIEQILGGIMCIFPWTRKRASHLRGRQRHFFTMMRALSSSQGHTNIQKYMTIVADNHWLSTSSGLGIAVHKKLTMKTLMHTDTQGFSKAGIDGPLCEVAQEKHWADKFDWKFNKIQERWG